MTAIASSLASLPTLTASNLPLETSEDKFGYLLDSSAIASDAEALRSTMQRDGYLYLPGLLNRDEVLAARLEVATRLQRAGQLEPGTDPMECVPATNVHMGFAPEVTLNNPQLSRVLYDGPMMAFYERLLGGPVRHFDFTWFRAVTPGLGTSPHTDAVYMNRGTHNLYTSWTPIGDVPIKVGGLMVLEGSHRIDRLRNNYSMKDVDKFCENKVGKDYTAMGGGGNIRAGGTLSNRPNKLRDALGGRWLTADYRAGDLLVFSIFTVHASLDNHGQEMRLSSDSRYQLASEAADERWIGPNPIAHGPEGKRGMIC